MSTSVTIRRPEAPLRAAVALPPSKSVANRALMLASLAGDPGSVEGFGQADDTRILRRSLMERPRDMHCGDGGTTFRFLLAWACVQEGEEHLITGSERLLQRPHGPLVQALRVLGADITESAVGLIVHGRKMKGGCITLHSPESSQFISALLLIAPCLNQGLQLQWTGLRLSEPYVRMTIALLKQFGSTLHEDAHGLHVAPGTLHAAPFHVPADWSAASFWYQIAATAPGSEVSLRGLKADGLQGDEAIGILLDGSVSSEATSAGIALRGKTEIPAHPFAADLVRTPDLFQPLAFTMAAFGRSATFTGLHNLPLKETDRLKAVADAVQVLGCKADHEAGTFHLSGPITNRHPPPFNPQGDHRMAMALAPLALICGAVTILDPEVVNKSYPGFWEDLERAGFLVSRA
ncbi:MAG: hypothetical protein M9900_08785 [Flavobacteriales bacterium]|nr:hypothetical protein [Flavobacteriales bacterium]